MGLVSSYGLAAAPTAGAATAPGRVRASVNGTLQLAAAVCGGTGASGSGSGGGNPRVGAEGEPCAPTQRAGPLEALRPFLQEHADHFWHELRCGLRVLEV